MNARMFASVISLAVALASCSGGGAAGSPPASILPTSSLPSTSKQIATGTITIDVPKAATTSSTARKPAFVSPATTFATLFIDSSLVGTRVYCTPGTAENANTGTCVINWTSTSGTHTFTVETDDGGPAGGIGQYGFILGDASVSESLTAGTNTLANITLNASPSLVVYQSSDPESSSSPLCAAYGQNTNCIVAYYYTNDIDGDIIVAPGDYDNGGICFSGGGNLTSVGPQCISTIPGAGVGSIIEQCVQGATGTFGVSDQAAVPLGTGSLSAAQISAYNLDYSNLETNPGFPTFSCLNGTISTVGPANGSVTVQSTNT
jgi:hypothetical protein